MKSVYLPPLSYGGEEEQEVLLPFLFVTNLIMSTKVVNAFIVPIVSYNINLLHIPSWANKYPHKPQAKTTNPVYYVYQGPLFY